eukprot:COSAG05_NODE_14_length_36349_cov_27.641655_5_plen_186_part_00
MGRDALEGDGLKGLLAVNEERVDSVAEAGDRAGAAGPSTRTSSERATNSDEVDELDKLIAEFFAEALGAKVDNQKTSESMTPGYCSTSRKVTGWQKALRGKEAGVTDFAWCRALVLVALHDASLAALQAEDSGYALDGWPSRALLLELLRIFGGCLGLGHEAAKLVDYQSTERKVEDIKKDSSGS